MQEKEVGDGTNFVLIFGGQLLQNAAELLGMVRKQYQFRKSHSKTL